MDTAHKKDAYFKEKFWFRTNILPTGKCYKYNILAETDYTLSNKFSNGIDGNNNPNGCCFNEDESYHQLYLREILEGREDLKFKGIYVLI